MSDISLVASNSRRRGIFVPCSTASRLSPLAPSTRASRMRIRSLLSGSRSVFASPISGGDGSGRLRGGDRARVSARLENPLAPGRYHVHCSVQQDQGKGEVDLFVHGAVDFVVFGGERSGSVLALDHEVSVEVEGSGP